MDLQHRSPMFLLYTQNIALKGTGSQFRCLTAFVLCVCSEELSEPQFGISPAKPKLDLDLERFQESEQKRASTCDQRTSKVILPQTAELPVQHDFDSGSRPRLTKHGTRHVMQVGRLATSCRGGSSEGFHL